MHSRYYELHLGEYCYVIPVAMSKNGSCPVAVAEEIAAVISALMNTSGGVLAVRIDTSRCQKQISLKEANEKIVNIITEIEKWIPRMLFKTFVSQRVIEKRHEIVFFINKANHFVTHCTSAYHMDGNDVKPLLEYQSICNILRGCFCTDESVCCRHLDEPIVFKSSLIKEYYIAGDIDYVRWFEVLGVFLFFEMPFQPLDGITYKYKVYSLQGRTLFEVLKSNSVQDEMRKIVSALANGDGGSLLLGVTDTDPPVVKGLEWDIPLFEEAEQLLLEIIDGKDHDSCVRIWSSASATLDQKAQKHWELFVHSVINCADSRCVLEIRVPQCNGGMFFDMPIGYIINPSGEISALRNFGEWKETLLQSFIAEPKENITVEDHFERETTEAETIVQSHFGSDKKPTEASIDPSEEPEQMKETHRDNVFQWWAAESDDVIAESYRFDYCCVRDFAAEVLDHQASFSLFPSIESTTQHHRDLPGLKQALLDIQERYKEDKGVGIVTGLMEDPIGELNLSSGTHQVCNIVIIRQSRRPVLISLMGTECTASLARQYSAVYASRLKRLCLLTYRELCDRNTYLCFERQVYRIGKGFEPLEENVSYPQEYLTPDPATIDIVRYTLAGILLSCEPLVDRFGNIMVRHLSACQARFMLKKTSKVTLVEGKAGSGKSVLALETMRRIKRQHGDRANILFLCRGPAEGLPPS